MDKKLVIEVKQVYGNEMIYPANDTAQVFADLVGTKTLSRMKLALIQGLGYVVEIKQQSLTI
jgi:phosphate/sulfate permease